MKHLILGILFCLSFEIYAQEISLEPGWKSSMRSFITKIAGEDWSNKLLGAAPVPAPKVAEVSMPEIPILLKKSTDVEAYTKIVKPPTEYDRLPTERKRQFDYNFIQELFRVTRKTDPNDEVLANWLNTLDQGGSREGVYQALVLDEVYYSLESMEEKPTKKLQDFYINFSKKFLNQGLKPDSISNLNLFSLKRILTEKSLDLIEYYEMKNLDQIYKWYANFSADLGQGHPELLTSEVRKNPSAIFHYEWAKKMPIQHIKSEFIIKLHGVMNGLQLVQK